MNITVVVKYSHDPVHLIILSSLSPVLPFPGVYLFQRQLATTETGSATDTSVEPLMFRGPLTCISTSRMSANASRTIICVVCDGEWPVVATDAVAPGGHLVNLVSTRPTAAPSVATGLSGHPAEF